MRCIFVVFTFLGLSSCFRGSYELNYLEHYTVGFNDLPEDVVVYLKNPSKYEVDFQNLLVVLPENKKVNYSLETINTFIGPWVSYEKLTDKKKGVFYKIRQGVPDPYILFENKLYIPDRFNILTTVNDFNRIKFTCYVLK